MLIIFNGMQKWWQMPNVGIGAGREIPKEVRHRTKGAGTYRPEKFVHDTKIETLRVYCQPESVVSLLALRHAAVNGPVADAPRAAAAKPVAKLPAVLIDLAGDQSDNGACPKRPCL